jgi:hypothetical protein
MAIKRVSFAMIVLVFLLGLVAASGTPPLLTAHPVLNDLKPVDWRNGHACFLVCSSVFDGSLHLKHI